MVLAPFFDLNPFASFHPHSTLFWGCDTQQLVAARRKPERGDNWPWTTGWATGQEGLDEGHVLSKQPKVQGLSSFWCVEITHIFTVDQEMFLSSQSSECICRKHEQFIIPSLHLDVTEVEIGNYLKSQQKIKKTHLNKDPWIYKPDWCQGREETFSTLPLKRLLREAKRQRLLIEKFQKSLVGWLSKPTHQWLLLTTCGSLS